MVVDDEVLVRPRVSVRKSESEAPETDTGRRHDDGRKPKPGSSVHAGASCYHTASKPLRQNMLDSHFISLLEQVVGRAGLLHDVNDMLTYESDGLARLHQTSAPPPKEKNDRKNELAANAIERPNTI